MCYDRSRMTTPPLSKNTFARAWGGTKPATKHRSPRLQGEAFIRALELVSAYLQGNDTAVAHMLSETSSEDACEIMYALLACAYAIDEAERGEHAPPDTPVSA
jgi:hypothetical protein